MATVGISWRSPIRRPKARHATATVQSLRIPDPSYLGPFVFGRQAQFRVKEKLVLTIPNPHGGDIGPKLLAALLRQAGLSRRDWERA